MATYTNSIIIRSQSFSKASSLIEALDVKNFNNNSIKKISDENIDYYSSLNDEGLAIGFWEDYIILTGYRVTEWIYDSICQRPSSSFQKLERLFPKFDAVLTFSNDTEMSFIFSIIQEGKKIRQKQVFHEKVQVQNDIGDLLPYELNYYSNLSNLKNNDLKSLKEYRSGYNDIDISLSIIEDFCGKMPDFDNLKMNIGIEKDLGKETIENLNESLGSEKDKLEKIISCINDGAKPLKLKKHKDFPKLSGNATRHQPGCILNVNEGLQIVIRPIIQCGYEVSLELKLEIKILKPNANFELNNLPTEFSFTSFLANHITIKKDFDIFLLNLENEMQNFVKPILNCNPKNIYTFIVNSCFSEKYFNMIISEAEKNKNKRNKEIPYMYRFDTLVKLLEIKKMLGLEDKQEVSTLFLSYLKEYKSIIDKLPESKYNNDKEKYYDCVIKFGN